ncbi:MAG: lasso peptide biosynthesis B2 protein [Acidobacteria bacterium]|jgi:hypothetical protein|nr:lasso peptide biosynthesis B2 protein [Acidobacteriota bacterium]
MKIRELSWYERRVLVQSCVLLPLTAVALRLIGLKRWQSALAYLARIDVSRPMAQVDPWRQTYATARMVKAAANNGFYRANCLQQSLALWWLLRRQRIISDLRIGVRKESGKFEAHAWVEFRGTALNETGDVHERFISFNGPISIAKAKS